MMRSFIRIQKTQQILLIPREIARRQLKQTMIRILEEGMNQPISDEKDTKYTSAKEVKFDTPNFYNIGMHLETLCYLKLK